MRSASVSRTDEVCRSYLDLRWHCDPAAASQAGLTQYHGRLGQYGEEAIAEHLAAFRALEAAVEGLDVAEAAEEIDRTALLDDIRATVFRLQHERPHRRNPAFWLLHLADALEAVRQPADPEDAMMALARVQAIPDFLRTAANVLGASAEPLIALARDLAPAVHGLIGEVEAGLLGEPQLAAVVQEAASEARGELESFLLVLESEIADEGTRPAGSGGDHFDRLLHHLHAVPTGAAEGWRYLLRREREFDDRLAALAGELGGEDWREALGGLMEIQGEPGDLAGEAGGELLRLAAFASDRALFPGAGPSPEVATLPAHLEVVTAHGVYRSRSWGAAAPARVELAGWPSTAVWLSPILAELGVPGLHLHHEQMAALEPEVRRHLEGRLTQGGWGLYAVHVLFEAGYWTTATDRLVALSHIYFRHLLARVDIGLHTHQLSVEEGVGFLIERLGIEPLHALAAVRGCLLEPTEAFGAILGCRELIRLCDDVREREGESFSAARFHAQVLGYGALPTPLIRWGMGFED
jgi:hypothetical protein